MKPYLVAATLSLALGMGAPAAVAQNSSNPTQAPVNTTNPQTGATAARPGTASQLQRAPRRVAKHHAYRRSTVGTGNNPTPTRNDPPGTRTQCRGGCG